MVAVATSSFIHAIEEAAAGNKSDHDSYECLVHGSGTSCKGCHIIAIAEAIQVRDLLIKVESKTKQRNFVCGSTESLQKGVGRTLAAARDWSLCTGLSVMTMSDMIGGSQQKPSKWYRT